MEDDEDRDSCLYGSAGAPAGDFPALGVGAEAEARGKRLKIAAPRAKKRPLEPETKAVPNGGSVIEVGKCPLEVVDMGRNGDC
eukprot:7702439-Alexandrium_andersonii.AAC.1